MFSKNLVNQINQISLKAGLLILEYYNNYKTLEVAKKQDNSPVTLADLAANNIIISELTKLFPDVNIVSEENSLKANLLAAQKNSYFMIDPLDGTSSFIKKSNEFTVNIAFIHKQKAIFGSIYLPAKDILYFTDETNIAYKINNFSLANNLKEQIFISQKSDFARVICTKREPEKSEIIKDLKSRNIQIKDLISVSSSYKFCLIAEGKADLYPRRAKINAWDIAAGHAIINAAGGKIINLDDNLELTYNFSHNFQIPFFECRNY